MPVLTGGQALVQQLKLEGIDTVFGLPGVQLDWAFDALYEERDSIRVLHTRHEQACGYMADGFARAGGRIGVCIVVPGPGLLNASAALATAYACSSPVLCITGQIDSRHIDKGRGLLHEIHDQKGMIAHVTKWQGLALSPAEVPGLVHEAVVQLQTGRPRPVEVEIPPDVLEAKAEVSLVASETPSRAAPDLDLVDRAARMLGEASQPLIFAGGGVISSGAWQELQRLAETLEAPVIMSVNAKGALSDRHHLGLPARAAADLAPEADAILFVGTRFVQGLMSPTSQPWLDGKTLIKLDVDPEEIDRNFTPTVGIVADARLGLAALADRVERYNRRRDSRREELMSLKQYLAEDAAKNQPQAGFAMAIRQAMPDDGVLVQESTQVGYWSAAAFPVYEPRTYFTAGYQGTLGFGFATALGAQVARPESRVISVNGDGGFFYNVQELSTMAQHQIPVIVIVFNDNAYGNVKRTQKLRFGGHVIATDLLNPDMLKLAEAYGVAGRRASSPAELADALRDVLHRDEPALIEVPVGEMPQARYTPRRAAS